MMTTTFENITCRNLVGSLQFTKDELVFRPMDKSKKKNTWRWSIVKGNHPGEPTPTPNWVLKYSVRGNIEDCVVFQTNSQEEVRRMDQEASKLMEQSGSEVAGNTEAPAEKAGESKLGAFNKNTTTASESSMIRARAAFDQQHSAESGEPQHVVNKGRYSNDFVKPVPIKKEFAWAQGTSSDCAGHHPGKLRVPSVFDQPASTNQRIKTESAEGSRGPESEIQTLEIPSGPSDHPGKLQLPSVLNKPATQPLHPSSIRQQQQEVTPSAKAQAQNVPQTIEGKAEKETDHQHHHHPEKLRVPSVFGSATSATAAQQKKRNTTTEDDKKAIDDSTQKGTHPGKLRVPSVFGQQVHGTHQVGTQQQHKRPDNKQDGAALISTRAESTHEEEEIIEEIILNEEEIIEEIIVDEEEESDNSSEQKEILDGKHVPSTVAVQQEPEATQSSKVAEMVGTQIKMMPAAKQVEAISKARTRTKDMNGEASEEPQILNANAPEQTIAASPSREAAAQIATQRQSAPSEESTPKESEDEGYHEQRRPWGKCIISLLMLAVVIVIVVAVIRGRKSRQSRSDEDGNVLLKRMPSSAPVADSSTLGPSSSPIQISPDLDLPDYTVNAILKDPLSAQYAAYMWLIEDPFLADYSSWRKMQRFALATFYFSFNGDHWPEEVKSGWLEHGASECSWSLPGFHGETFEPVNQRGNYSNVSSTMTNSSLVSNDGSEISVCDDQGHYIALGFQESNQMDSSNYLDFVNSFEGTMPPEVSFLTSLVSISIHTNATMAELLSVQLQALSSLTTLDLSRCEFQTWDFSVIPHLESLQALNLSHNDFQGRSISTEFGFLENLIQLDLSAAYNSTYSSTIPTEIALLTGLEELYLSENRYKGPIPSELGLMRALGKLKVVQYNLLYCVDLCI